MPVLKVVLEGWKTHRKTEIELSPLTVLVGPNSVGKTSVLEAIQHAANAGLSGLSMNEVYWEARRFLRRGNESYSVTLALKAAGLAHQNYLQSDGLCIWDRHVARPFEANSAVADRNPLRLAERSESCWPHGSPVSDRARDGLGRGNLWRERLGRRGGHR